jgi:hypothetical protein
MDKYESYAVGHFLSSYPEGMGFTDLMQALRNDSSEIWPWELVEAVPLEDLAGLIEDMVSSLRMVFK